MSAGTPPRYHPTEFVRDATLLAFFRTVWDQLPLFVAAALLTAIAAVPAGLLFLAGLIPIGILVLALMWGPVIAAITRMTARLLIDDVVTVRALFSQTLREPGRGISVALILSLPLVLLSATLALRNANPEQSWLIVPILVDCSMVLIVAICAVPVFTLSTVYRLGGLALWTSALALGRANLTASVGSVMTVLVAGWLCVTYAPTLAVLLAAPWFALNTFLTIQAVERAET